ETKMSDGGRDCPSLGGGVLKSSQKRSVRRSAVRSIAWLDLNVLIRFLVRNEVAIRYGTYHFLQLLTRPSFVITPFREQDVLEVIHYAECEPNAGEDTKKLFIHRFSAHGADHVGNVVQDKAMNQVVSLSVHLFEQLH